MVMVATALLLADMERKRRVIVDLIDRLAPLTDNSRRLPMGNIRRLSRSPFHTYGLIDALEREIGFIEEKREVSAPEDDSGLLGSLAGARLQRVEARLNVLSGTPGADTGTDS